MDEEHLRELLRSPLDDLPERSVPRQVLVGTVVVAAAALVFAAGALLLRSGGDAPAVTAAAPAATTLPGGDEPAVTPGTGTAAGAATTAPETVPVAAGYPDVGGLAAMAPVGAERAVMFGGGLEQAASGIVGRGFPEGELWSLDLSGPGWERLEPEPPAPEARTGATLTPLGQSGELLLFGGSADALFFCSPVPLCSRNLLNDTWVFDVARSAWTEVAAGTDPEPRVGHAAVYDAESGVVVLFGGARIASGRSGTNLGDTWAWVAETRSWRQMSPPEPPPARSYHAMAYDPELDLVVLWGGDSSEGGENDREVWGYDYDDDEWQVLGGGTEPPEPPWYHQMAYEPDLGEIVVVGGWVTVVRDLGGGVTATNVGPTDDVWALDAGAGAFRRLTPTPEPVSQAGLAVLPGRGIAAYAGAHTYLYDPFADEWSDLTGDLGGL